MSDPARTSPSRPPDFSQGWKGRALPRVPRHVRCGRGVPRRIRRLTLPSSDRLKKRASRPARGYPIASVAFYGPTEQIASKVVVGITAIEGADVAPLERWYSPDQDARKNPQLLKTVLQFLEAPGVKSVVMPDRLLGCPHEEGIDYPEEEPCPQCVLAQPRSVHRRSSRRGR